jgi:hypothetical protein
MGFLGDKTIDYFPQDYLQLYRYLENKDEFERTSKET